MARPALVAYRSVGFLAVPIVNALLPLLVLPSITAHFGAAGWASMAIAQSLGAAGSVLTELGWGLVAPQRVARQSRSNARALFGLVLATKLLAILPVALLAAPAALALTSEHRVEAAWLAALGCAGSMSNAWFFIGTRHPLGIILADSLPRILPLVVCVALLEQGFPLATYVLALGVSVALTPLVGLLIVGWDHRVLRLLQWRVVRVSLRSQLTALTGRAVSSTYMALPVSLVAIASPASVPLFAACERLLRMALTALQPFPNMMQGWVGSAPDRSERLRRAGRSLALNAVVGVCCGTLFALAAPPASALLFSNVATVPGELAWLGGLLIGIVCTSRASGGIVLVARRKVHVVATSAVVGCLVGVPGIVIGAAALGPLGGLLGEITGELAVLGVQVASLTRQRERASSGGGP